jgi:hypothetical protein
LNKIVLFSRIIGSQLVWLQLTVTLFLEFAIIFINSKSYIVHIELMNPDSGTNDNNDIRKTKARAAISMAGMIVIAALVSGVAYSMGNSYQPTIAQTGNATTTTRVGQFPCAPAQTGGGGGGQNTSTTATTTGDAASTDVDTTSTTDEGNQFTGELAIHIQEACLAAHNNDIPGVLLHLNLALEALNAVRAGGVTNATAAFEEGGLMLDPGGPERTEVEPEEEG